MIDYIVDIAFFLAPGSLGTGSAWFGFLYQRGLLCIYFHGLPIYSPKFTESVRWSSLLFSKWSQSSQGNLFLSLCIFSSDLRDWVLEWLEIASCHVAYSPELGKPLVSDICSSCLSFVDCLLPSLYAHTLMTGLPPIPGWISKLTTVFTWFLDSVWKKLASFETNHQNRESLLLIMHHVQTWIPRIIGTPSLGSSVESPEHNWALCLLYTKYGSWTPMCVCVCAQVHACLCMGISLCLSSLSLVPLGCPQFYPFFSPSLLFSGISC